MIEVAPPGRAVQVAYSRFVTIDLAAHITGFTPKAIRMKIDKSVWLEGRHWVKRDGRILIDMKGYEQWAETAAA